MNTKIMALFVMAILMFSVAPTALAASFSERGQTGLDAATKDWKNLNAEYDQYKAEYKAAKAELVQLKADLKKRGSLTQADIPAVQDYFHTALDLAVTHTQRASKLIGETSLTDKATYVARLDGYANSLNAMHADVDAASTRAEFNALGVKIRDEYNKVNAESKEVACLVGIDRVNIAIDAAEGWYNRAVELTDEAEAAGTNVDRQRKALAQARSDIDKAIAESEASLNECRAVSNAANFDQAIRNANQKRDKAVSYVRSSISALRSLV